MISKKSQCFTSQGKKQVVLYYSYVFQGWFSETPWETKLLPVKLPVPQQLWMYEIKKSTDHLAQRCIFHCGVKHKDMHVGTTRGGSRSRMGSSI